jgi:glycosyltransferase involved in cell wall biosynthesis
VRLLILTQYFPPEIGAPQNRLYELAVRLKQKGIQVTILTAMPNYPGMVVHPPYRTKIYCREDMNGLDVHRSWIYVSQSKSMVGRLMNYFSFVVSAFFAGWFKLGEFDFILCESPPLFLGITAFLLKKLKHARLIFNVSDLWPESAEKLGLVTNRTVLKLSTALEEFLYRHSDLICGQTRGIVKYISRRFPDKKLHWLPNGVDMDYFYPETVNNDWRVRMGYAPDDFILLYAGILGHAQGLEIIIKAAVLLRQYPKIKFIMLGMGPKKEELVDLKNQLGTERVHFLDAVTKIEMPSIIAASDAAIIPLRKLDLFKGAIPSKIFENSAMKKPILLGVEGEAKDLFITEGNAGLPFEPENPESLCTAILTLYENRNLCVRLGLNGYNYVKARFTRDRTANDFFELLNTSK